MVAFNWRHLSRTVRSASTTPQVDHARQRRVDPSRSISSATRSTHPLARPKWNIPITAASLGIGAIGFAAGAHLLLLGIGGLLQGGREIMSMLREQQATALYRVISLEAQATYRASVIMERLHEIGSR
jgi:hypothetical protein